MESLLHLEVVSPDQTVINEHVDYVSLPGINGELGILPQHLPLLSVLTIGKLYYRQGASTYYAFIAGGFVEISSNKVTILTEAAERSKDIDISRAQKARERAEAYLLKNVEDSDIKRAEAAIHRAIIRLEISRI